MRSIGKAVAKAAVSILAGTAVVGGGLFVAGLASASDTKPAATTTTAMTTETATASGQAERPRLLKGAVHVEITALYADGSTRSFSADRGRIKSTDGGTLVLQQPNDDEVSVPTNDGTCIRKDGQPAALGDLEVDARALALQESGAAVVIRSGRPQPGA
jgi:hypothetical protein